jgi:hypothetical protein
LFGRQQKKKPKKGDLSCKKARRYDVARDGGGKRDRQGRRVGRTEDRSGTQESEARKKQEIKTAAASESKKKELLKGKEFDAPAL